MPIRQLRNADNLDPKTTFISFPSGVRKAFGDLAAAVHFSDTFSPEMLLTVQEWAAGKKHSVDDVIGTLMLIGKDTFEHVQATGDQRAADAWTEIASELLERGFKLEGSKLRGR